MSKYSDQIIPFYIAKSAEGVGAVTSLSFKLREASLMEIQVLSGGPVFLFKQAVSASEAYAATHGKQLPLFDLGAVPGQSAETILEPSLGQVTVCSDNESIGFIRLRDCAHAY